ncbi:hypothetical protein [Paenibacillus gansuensis]|uniref:Uncharacterized protein n=1 Tax=Paenibacillus gansuensis TaxID=306542 RepID=A0ABW5PE39_9BACL
MSKGKNQSMQQANQSAADLSNNASKSKANTKSPSESGFHEPSRPSN